MPYTAAHVANFFIDRANSENISLTQMKLQKLVYIGFGWVLALTDESLFDEDIQAWQHGPVIPSLYHEFKHFRASPIEGFAVSYDLDSDECQEPRIPASEKTVHDVLGKVWNVYKQFSGSALRSKTHERNTPWSNTFDDTLRHAAIPSEEIGDHFHRKIGEYLNAAT